MTTTKTKPDYTLSALKGVDELTALGFEIEDDALPLRRRPVTLPKPGSCTTR